MNCFQLIKSVLDDAYHEIAESPEEKDKRILISLDELGKAYKNLYREGCFDYSDPLRRFAYIYRYTTMHANLVFRVCQRSDAIQELLKKDSLRMAAIGGGPGSDFLGIIKYCEENGLNPSINLQIYDRDPAWGESWIDLNDRLDDGVIARSIFQTFDVINKKTWQGYINKISKVDLVTFVYFFSEVYAKKEEASPFFEELLSRLKAGALVLFIDNYDSSFYGWFDDLAKKHGLNLLLNKKGEMKMPFEENASDLGDYFKKFGHPRLKASVAIRLAQKQ